MNFFRSIKTADILLGVVPFIVVVLIVFFVAEEDKFTPFEITLLQIIQIIATTFSAGYFATRLAERNNQGRAKLALRRIASVFTFFQNLIGSIQQQNDFLDKISDEDGKIDKNYVNQTLNSISTQVLQQINTANDAVDDWKDLVPDAEEVLRRYKEKGGKNDN